LLTDRYLQGIPQGSRASRPNTFLRPERVTPEVVAKVEVLNTIATQRGQTMAQMALAWVLRRKTVTSALIGASSTNQLEDNVAALKNIHFSQEELDAIDKILKE